MFIARLLMSFHRIFPLLFSFLFCFLDGTTQRWVIDSETGALVNSTNSVPFGLQMNQWGEIPSEGPFAFQRFRLRDTLRVILPNRPHWTWRYGASVALNQGTSTDIRLSSAYVGLQTKVFGVRVGRWKEIQGITDSTVSSGSFTWSGNSLPIPRVEVGIPNYTPILASGLISIKALIAHGWFTDGAVLNSWLHQKSLFVRVGRPEWKLRMYTGINHQAQWGGRLATPIRNPANSELISNLPSDFTTWVNVMLGTSLNRDGNGLGLTNVPLNEALNRAGNHLGGVDIALEFQGKKGRWLFYKQSFFEDGSLYYLTSIGDGVFGLSYRSHAGQKPFHFGVEFINTLSQGGRTGSNFNTPQLRGADNYFNNSLYADGWTYQGRVIGNPLLMQTRDLNPVIQQQFEKFNLENGGLNRDIKVLSNRVTGIHFKAQYAFSALHLSSQVFALETLGNYGFRFSAQYLGVVQSFERTVGKRGASVRCRVSGQWGDLLTPSWGVEAAYIHPFRIW